MEQCTGTLMWFEVPVDARFSTPAGLLKCSDCDYVTVTTNELDDRHRDAMTMRID